MSTSPNNPTKGKKTITLKLDPTSGKYVVPDQYLDKLTTGFPPTLLKEVNIAILFKPGRQTEIGVIPKDKVLPLETITDAMQFRRSAGFIRRILKNDETEKGIENVRNFLYRANLLLPNGDRPKFTIREEFRNSFAQAKTWISNLYASRDTITKNYSSELENELYKAYLHQQTLRIETAIVKFLLSFIDPWEKKTLQRCLLENHASVFLFDKLAKSKVQMELSRPVWKLLFPANTPKGIYITLEESRDEKFCNEHKLILSRTSKLLECYSIDKQSHFLPEKEEKYYPNLKLGESLRKFRIVVVPSINYKSWLIWTKGSKQMNALPINKDFVLYSKINQAELDFFTGRLPLGFNSKSYWEAISGLKLREENPQTGGFKDQVTESTVKLKIEEKDYYSFPVRTEYLTKFLSGITDTKDLKEDFEQLSKIQEERKVPLLESPIDEEKKSSVIISFSYMTQTVDSSQQSNYSAFLKSKKMTPYHDEKVERIRRSTLTPNSKLTTRSRQIVEVLRKNYRFVPIIENIQDFLQSFVSLSIQTAAAEQIYATQNRFYYESTPVETGDAEDESLPGDADPLPEIL
jgi:hypothetical protein